MKKYESDIKATVGTVILMLLLFLLLWFVRIGAPKQQEDEGIEVAFGAVDEAGGYQEQQTEAVPLQAEEAAAPAEPEAPSNNDLMTQEDEEALALARQREQQERERQQAEAEKRQRQAEERARAEAEARAKAEADAARKAKEDAAIAKANQFGGLFGKGCSEEQGSGDSKGGGQKGNPVGHGSVGGNDWSLAGREAKAIPRPDNNFRQEGKVVVEIQVNPAGQVINATLGAGSTVSDAATINLAIEAAKKAVFSAGDKAARGTITYHFRFN